MYAGIKLANISKVIVVCGVPHNMVKYLNDAAFPVEVEKDVELPEELEGNSTDIHAQEQSRWLELANLIYNNLGKYQYF